MGHSDADRPVLIPKFLQLFLITYSHIFIFLIDLREKEREMARGAGKGRERHRFVVPFIDAFTGYVQPWVSGQHSNQPPGQGHVLPTLPCLHWVPSL